MMMSEQLPDLDDCGDEEYWEAFWSGQDRKLEAQAVAIKDGVEREFLKLMHGGVGPEDALAKAQEG